MFFRICFAGLAVSTLSIFLTPIIFASTSRGVALYKMCSSCHGQRGEGNESLGAPAIAGLPMWYQVGQIQKFRAGLRGAHPQDFAGLRMRSIARILQNEKDIKAVTQYISELLVFNPPSKILGDVPSGQRSYQLCASCHGARGEGNKTMQAPPLHNLNDWYLAKQINNFKNGFRGVNASQDPLGATMVPMAKTLADDQAIRDVVSYINTLK